RSWRLSARSRAGASTASCATMSFGTIAWRSTTRANTCACSETVSGVQCHDEHLPLELRRSPQERQDDPERFAPDRALSPAGVAAFDLDPRLHPGHLASVAHSA